MRWYTVTDPPGTEPIRLPSVTTILDVTMPQHRRDTLVRAEMANPVSYAMRREQALARGVAVDGWAKKCVIARRILGRPHPVEKQCLRLLPLIKALIDRPDFLWTDEKVYSAAYGCAGTLDIVGVLEDEAKALVELKTSAYTIWPEAIEEAQLQAAAYAQLWNKMHPLTAVNAIASYHVTPYMLHVEVRRGAAMAKTIAGWEGRRRLFASRFSQLEL